jgi:F0F1-type ATP synthase membrane subunit b/b'
MAKKSKQEVRKLVRRGERALRQARLEAKVIKAEAQVEAARIREAALVDATTEAARITTNAHSEAARILEQTRNEADTTAAALRQIAEADARTIVAQAELTAERVKSSADTTAQQLMKESMQEREHALRNGAEERSRLRDEALLDAARIRDLAAHEVTAWVRRLDDERDELLADARARADAILDAAREQIEDLRLRAFTESEQRREQQARANVEVPVDDSGPDDSEPIAPEADAQLIDSPQARALDVADPGVTRLSWTASAATVTLLGHEAPAPPEAHVVESETAPATEERGATHDVKIVGLNAALDPPTLESEMRLDDLIGPEPALTTDASPPEHEVTKPRRRRFRFRRREVS